MTHLNIASEYEEQSALVEYLELLKSNGKILLFSAVPNNTFTRSWSQKRKQKMEGVRPGVPDLIIVTHNHVLFLEMKRGHLGKLSEYQKEWLSALPSKKVLATVAKGFDEAKKVVDTLLKEKV